MIARRSRLERIPGLVDVSGAIVQNAPPLNSDHRAAGDDADRATKILTTVELLYPEWGGSDRLERAGSLKESLGLK